MKYTLLVFFLLFGTQYLFGQSTYYWVGGTTANADFNQASNWNTILGGGGSNRVSPAANDVLVFDGSNYGSPSATSATVYNIPAQTIGKLILQNSAMVTFASASSVAATVLPGTVSGSGNTVTGSAGTNFSTLFSVGDFFALSQWGAQMSLITSVGTTTLTTAENIAFGSTSYYKAATLRITGASGLNVTAGSTLNVTISNAPFAISVQSGASGLLQGNVNYIPQSTQAYRLVSFSANGITVDSAAVFTNGPNCRGNVFSTNALPTNNNIQFKKGGVYVHNPTNANVAESQVPFGSTVIGPQSVIDLQPGSKMVYKTSKGASFAGFKYGDIELYTSITTTASPAFVGNFTIWSGNTFTNNSTTPFPVSGNMLNNGVFTTSAASTLLMCGEMQQTISGSGSYFVNQFIVSNVSDVILAQNVKLLSTTTFNSSSAVVIDGTQVLANNPSASLGLALNNFLEGPGTPRTTPFITAAKQMNMRTLRFPEGEFGDWYLWSKPPYSAPDPHAGMWGGSLFPFNQGNIFNLSDTTGKLTTTQLDLGQFLTLCKDSGFAPYIIVPIDPIMKPNGVTKYVAKQEILDNAVGMVNYVKQRGFPTVYYEIGNENYYPISGTATSQVWTATDYANQAVEITNLMKAADSTIKIGVNGHNWPNTKWYDTLMMIASNKADFLVAHNYLRDMSSISTAKNSWYNSYLTMINNNTDILQNVTEANAAINNLTNATDKARIKIAVTEGGPYSPGVADSINPQTNTMGKAIITADMFASILSNSRVTDMHFWTSHWFLTASQTNNQPFNIRNLLGGNNEITPIGMATQLLNETVVGKKVGVTDLANSKKYQLHMFYDPVSGKANMLVINRDSVSKTIPVQFNNLNLSNKTTWQVKQVSGNNIDDYTLAFDSLTNVSTDALGRMNITVPPYSLTRYSF